MNHLMFIYLKIINVLIVCSKSDGSIPNKKKNIYKKKLKLNFFLGRPQQRLVDTEKTEIKTKIKMVFGEAPTASC